MKDYQHKTDAEEPLKRRVECVLRDVEGAWHPVPRAWHGACADEVMRKMLHVRCWVPFIVREVIELEVKG